MHGAEDAGRVGVGLGKLSVGSHRVVSWKLGEGAGDCTWDETGASEYSYVNTLKLAHPFRRFEK